MIFPVVLTLIVALAIAMLVCVGRDRGPSPADTATSYELAWDRLDFASVWTLSAPGLRDGLDRKAFVAAKREAYRERPDLGRLIDRVTVDAVRSGDNSAAVATRLALRDGTVVRNEIGLLRRHGRWEIATYALQPDAQGA